MAKKVSAEDSFHQQDGFCPWVIHPLITGWGINELHKDTSESQPLDTVIVTEQE